MLRLIKCVWLRDLACQSATPCLQPGADVQSKALHDLKPGQREELGIACSMPTAWRIPTGTRTLQLHWVDVLCRFRVAAVEKAEAEKVQVVKAAEADAEVSFRTQRSQLTHPCCWSGADWQC